MMINVGVCSRILLKAGEICLPLSLLFVIPVIAEVLLLSLWLHFRLTSPHMQKKHGLKYVKSGILEERKSTTLP
jgi:hypothetical protein